MIRQNLVQILVILEPKVAHSELRRFAYNMGFPYGNENQHIWILWKAQTEIYPIHISSQAITVHIWIPQQ